MSPPSLPLNVATRRFLDHLEVELRRAHNTLASYGADLAAFCAAVGARRAACVSVTDVREQDVLDHLAYLTAAGCEPSTRARHLATIRGLFRFLLRGGAISADPTERVAGPTRKKQLPTVLTHEEVETLLAVPDRQTPRGLRDGALLELAYATGLRVSELVGLRVGDVRWRLGFLKVVGKGRRERLVPVHALALQAVRAWCVVTGGGRLPGPREPIFVSNRKTAMTRERAWQLVIGYARVAGIRKPLSPQTLRNAFASHLVAHGADLSSVQALLGHAAITTTQVYVQACARPDWAAER